MTAPAPGELPFTAVVLAGGGGRRLGGIDKPGLLLGTTSLLQRAVDAAAAADEIVVVGPTRPLHRSTGPAVRWTREDPPGGGPVAALAAGLAATTGSARWLLVLAADLPAVTPATVDLLRAAAGVATADAVLATDRTGRRQQLLALYRRSPLEHAISRLGITAGASVRHLLAPLDLHTVPVAADADDIDTPEDLDRWQGDPPSGSPNASPNERST